MRLRCYCPCMGSLTGDFSALNQNTVFYGLKWDFYGFRKEEKEIEINFMFQLKTMGD